MELQNATKIFENALKGKYAVGAFNFVNMEVLQGILEAAVEENSPVIIQCSTGAIKYAGNSYLKGMVLSATKDLNIPVIWNLDHGKTYEDCVKAITYMQACTVPCRLKEIKMTLDFYNDIIADDVISKIPKIKLHNHPSRYVSTFEGIPIIVDDTLDKPYELVFTGADDYE